MVDIRIEIFPQGTEDGPILLDYSPRQTVSHVISALEKRYNAHGDLKESNGVLLFVNLDKPLRPGDYEFHLKGDRAAAEKAPSTGRAFLQKYDQAQAGKRLPTPSDVANKPHAFMDFLGSELIRMHRPVNMRPPPLVLTSSIFGTFVKDCKSCKPSRAACTFAIGLCTAASKVHTDEVVGLQPLVHDLVEGFLGSEYTVTSSMRGTSQADEIISKDGHNVGDWELQTDRGGNLAGQAARYMTDEVHDLMSEDSPLAAHTCLPRLYAEINGATLRILGLAYERSSSTLSCEPLTYSMHLFCNNNQEHMWQLARVLTAYRRAVDSIAALNAMYAAQPVLPAAVPETFVPYDLVEKYPSATFRSRGRDILFTVHQDGQPVRMVKYMQLAENPYAVLVQRTWAAGGLAPRVLEERALPGGYTAVEMEYCSPEDGWVTVADMAPVDAVRHGKRQILQLPAKRTRSGELRSSPTEGGPGPTSPELWEDLQVKASDALNSAHRLDINDPKDRTKCLGRGVHGDMRLPNVMARFEGNKVTAIKFVDFDWAGLHRVSRYPVTMNPDINWPSGAQPCNQLRQNHDHELLSAEFDAGGGTA